MAVALLWERGTLGIEVQPAAAGAVTLLTYFADGQASERELCDAFAALHDTTLESVPIPEVDWLARFKESFRPLQAGSFRIAPPWRVSAGSRRRSPAKGPRDGTLIIEPGRAFGTGTHESTRLCLHALERLAARGPIDRVLDLGTGTGILAIAAGRLGCRRVTAVDVDPDALASASHHARLNRARLDLVHGDGGRPFLPAAFDLVLANVTTSLLLERASEIAALLAPGGAAVLAGLLAADLPAVLAAYEKVGRLDTLSEGEWAAVIAARRS